MNGQLFGVSVSLGKDVTSTMTNEVEQAVDSFYAKPGRWG